MSFETVSLKLSVRPNDLDSLGHVNNATVLEYMEAGRWAWLDHHGFRRGRRIIPVVARIEVNYRKEIPPGEVAVTTKLEEDGETSHYRRVFCQTVETLNNGTQKVAAEARVQVAFIDSVDRILRTVEDFLQENEQ
ncbi:MAG: acyl-CoA thioesterase [Oscillatoria princeps RMCB-10]|nr:acyl-CoA thioesterase [Oscillatoria princeps RMCB-10]